MSHRTRFRVEGRDDLIIRGRRGEVVQDQGISRRGIGGQDTRCPTVESWYR